MDGNPYQPPRSEVVDAKELDELGLASRWLRLGAAVIDLVIALAYSLPMQYALKIYTYAANGVPVPFRVQLLAQALGFVCFVLLHGYFLQRNGQTIGKKLVGIRVVHQDDSAVSLGGLVVRRYLPMSLCALIPVVGVWLAVAEMLLIFRADRRCVHDLIARTKVVSC